MPYLIILGVGFAGGFFTGNATSNLAKWGLVAGGGYLAAKHFKVI